MTSRSHIIDGNQAIGRKFGLIYTKKCGWIDLGHANPHGALELWQRIKNERNGGALAPTANYFRITYEQMMGRKNSFKLGIRKMYDIKKGLTIADKKSVALSIFLDVSHSFESLQSNWLFRQFTTSGYSAEDLVSNLIGFYRAVEPRKQFLQMCQPVNKSVALQIWDTYGAVGSNKNYSAAPFIYPIPPASGGPMCAPLPSYLNTIKPAKEGILYKEVK